MALKETMRELSQILTNIGSDLPKAGKGNKAASQRIRTSTIRFEKVGKKYRKESLTAEKVSSPQKMRVARKKSARKKRA